MTRPVPVARGTDSKGPAAKARPARQADAGMSAAGYALITFVVIWMTILIWPAPWWVPAAAGAVVQFGAGVLLTGTWIVNHHRHDIDTEDLWRSRAFWLSTAFIVACVLMSGGALRTLPAEPALEWAARFFLVPLVPFVLAPFLGPPIAAILYLMPGGHSVHGLTWALSLCVNGAWVIVAHAIAAS